MKGWNPQKIIITIEVKLSANTNHDLSLIINEYSVIAPNDLAFAKEFELLAIHLFNLLSISDLWRRQHNELDVSNGLRNVTMPISH